MPLAFGYDPCDDVVHWLIWLKKESKLTADGRP